MTRIKEKSSRARFIERALTATLLIGGISAIYFQDVKSVLAQSDKDPTLVAENPNTTDTLNAQVLPVAPSIDVLAPAVDSPIAITSPDTAIDLKLFPEVLGDPKSDRLVIFNHGQNHGLNLDPDSLRFYEQTAALYADKYKTQGKAWKNIRLNFYDDESSINETTTPLYVPEYFISINGTKSNVGAVNYGGFVITQDGNQLTLNIGLNNNADLVLNGPLFDNSNVVGAVVPRDNNEFIDYRKTVITQGLDSIIGSLIEYNDPEVAHWPNQTDENGVSNPVHSSDIANLISNFSLQII